MDFNLAVTRYLETPTLPALNCIREAIRRDDHFTISGDSVLEGARLLTQGRHEDAVGWLAMHRIANFFSPRGHLIFARALRATGREELAETEQALASIAMEALVSSGTGQLDEPFIVLRVPDEYDVLAHLRKRPGSQGLMMDGMRQLDEFELEDGSSLWFELFRGGSRP